MVYKKPQAQVGAYGAFLRQLTPENLKGLSPDSKRSAPSIVAWSHSARLLTGKQAAVARSRYRLRKALPHQTEQKRNMARPNSTE